MELFTGLHLAGRELLVPSTAVAEAGPEVEAMFLGSIADGDFRAADLLPDDHRRAADLVRRYGDLPLGTTDATVIALTERLELTEVATLDHRHFSVVRPRHVDALVLLP